MKNYEGTYILINEVKHYFVFPKNIADKPFLLFLHGGPGETEMMMVNKNDAVFGENFNVVYYEQRGTGRTYRKNKNKKADINLLLKDLKEIVQYLKKRFDIEKLALLGYSWGSVLASIYIKNNPEDIICYIGLGQVIDFQENETQGYLKLKEEIIKANHENDLIDLFEITPYPEQAWSKSMMRKLKKFRKLQGKYRLATKITFKNFRQMLFNPSFGFRDYWSLKNGIKYNKELYSFLINFSLYNYDYQYKIPIYYVMGENDYQTPTALAQRYFDKIVAPEKRIFILKEAGHALIEDNPEDFIYVVREIAANIILIEDGQLLFEPYSDQPHQNP